MTTLNGPKMVQPAGNVTPARLPPPRPVQVVSVDAVMKKMATYAPVLTPVLTTRVEAYVLFTDTD